MVNSSNFSESDFSTDQILPDNRLSQRDQRVTNQAMTLYEQQKIENEKLCSKIRELET